MKKSIVFFILTIGWLIEGCYEDKGHYDYIRISGPEVTGIENFIRYMTEEISIFTRR